MPIPVAAILTAIADSTGRAVGNADCRPVAGGDINACFHLVAGGDHWFVKTNIEAAAEQMFRAEAEALTALAGTASLDVPTPIACGSHEGTAFLVMTYIALGGPPDWPALGAGLAGLHAHTAARFGWHADNFIGTTIQHNTHHDDWASFWWHCRLQPQLSLAQNNGYTETAAWRGPLQEACRQLLAGHRPAPSLVHGDLWSGNAGFTNLGMPVIFDPAAYHGDREVDIAMTRLFGGFPPAFYAAYESACPLPAGSAQRELLYNLYHLLNHLNLFGRSYLANCTRSVNLLCDQA